MQEASPGFRSKSSLQPPRYIYIDIKDVFHNIYTNLTHPLFSLSSNRGLDHSSCSRTGNSLLTSLPDILISQNTETLKLSNCVSIIKRIPPNNSPIEFIYIFIIGLGSYDYYPSYFTLQESHAELDLHEIINDFLMKELIEHYQSILNNDLLIMPDDLLSSIGTDTAAMINNLLLSDDEVTIDYPTAVNRIPMLQKLVHAERIYGGKVLPYPEYKAESGSQSCGGDSSAENVLQSELNKLAPVDISAALPINKVALTTNNNLDLLNNISNVNLLPLLEVSNNNNSEITNNPSNLIPLAPADKSVALATNSVAPAINNNNNTQNNSNTTINNSNNPNLPDNSKALELLINWYLDRYVEPVLIDGVPGYCLYEHSAEEVVEALISSALSKSESEIDDAHKVTQVVNNNTLNLQALYDNSLAPFKNNKKNQSSNSASLHFPFRKKKINSYLATQFYKSLIPVSLYVHMMWNYIQFIALYSIALQLSLQQQEFNRSYIVYYEPP
jgi:hypothetical protein